MRKIRPLQDRFWEKVNRLGPDECWLWTAGRYPKGYGMFGVADGVVRQAHRIAWELTNGAIPPGPGHHGTCVLHKCDVPLCCNPAHLFLGSNQDNIDDMRSKDRHAFGERHHHKLSDEKVVEIKNRLATGARHYKIAAEYGVSQTMISRIGRGEGWKHIKGPQTVRRYFSEQEKQQIKEKYREGTSQRALAAEYGVLPATIHYAIRGPRIRKQKS